MAPGIRIATSAWLTTFAMAPDASSRDVAATLAANRLLQLIIGESVAHRSLTARRVGKNCRRRRKAERDLLTRPPYSGRRGPSRYGNPRRHPLDRCFDREGSVDVTREPAGGAALSAAAIHQGRT